MSSDPLPAANRPSSKLRGWGEALGITLVGILLAGVGCFMLLGNYLYRQVQEERMDLLHAAAWWEIGFGIAMGLILALIIVWQRAHGSSLEELGWRKPAPPLAYGLAVGLAILFLSGSYFGTQRVLSDVNILEINGLRLALAPLGIFLAIGEEMMMRGFFMTALHRAGVATWVQILASGACSASYHALQNPTPIGFFPSFVLFSLHASLYVASRRSLTPVILTHSLYHVLGQPYLLMMAMMAMKH